VGAVAHIVGGGTPRTNDPSNYEGGDIPWITPADLSGYTEKYIARGSRNITEKGLSGSSARLMPAGTVLLSSRAPIGYVAIASQPVSTNQGFKSFVLPDGVDSSYLYHYLKRAKDLIVDLASGTTFLEISGTNATLVPLPLPPLAEQRRIVAAIEEQLTRLDAAVAGLERARANLKRYRAAVLAAACSGRLVPTEAELARREGRDYEPAGVLLQRILAERRARWEADQLARLHAQGKPPKDDAWKRKYQVAQTVDPPKRVFLTEGWTWAALDQLLCCLRNGLSTKPDQSEGVRILRISAVRPLSVNMEDVRYLSGRVGDYSDYILETDDLLFTRYNGNPELVGVCGVVRHTSGDTAHPDKLIRGKVVSADSLPRYLEIALNVGPSRDFLARRVRTTAGQSGVSGGDLKQTPVPLPPLAEQHRIVAEVERRLSVVEELERAVEHALARAARLRQSVLRRAFEGRLVPQDPADEPASVLLERIRAERAATTSTKRPRRAAKRGQLALPEAAGEGS